MGESMSSLEYKIACIKHRVSSANICCICLNDISNKSIVSFCSHSFCLKCITTWLSLSRASEWPTISQSKTSTSTGQRPTISEEAEQQYAQYYNGTNQLHWQILNERSPQTIPRSKGSRPYISKLHQQILNERSQPTIPRSTGHRIILKEKSPPASSPHTEPDGSLNLLTSLKKESSFSDWAT